MEFELSTGLASLLQNETTDVEPEPEEVFCTENVTVNCSYPDESSSAWMSFNLILYALICAAGLVGNGLVIYVVLRYSKMRTSVTNVYIVNLAVSDFCFLVGLPFVIVTAVCKQWIFGYVFCKIFYILTSLNWFTSVFTLTVMSADRYLAVCYAVESRRYRTPTVSCVVCAAVWIASLLVMLPIYLYGQTVESEGTISCTIKWPEGQVISAEQAFIWYAFSLGFAIPVAMISVFYFLVVYRLRAVGPIKQSKGKKKSQRKVTIMVLTVITVYVICWLPYWLFQITMLFVEYTPPWSIALFQLITVLSYANSAFNPVLYAFLSDNFRKTFSRAFRCASAAEVNRELLRTDRTSLAPPTTLAGPVVAGCLEKAPVLPRRDESLVGDVQQLVSVTATRQQQQQQQQQMQTKADVAEMQVLLPHSNRDSGGLDHDINSSPDKSV